MDNDTELAGAIVSAAFSESRPGSDFMQIIKRLRLIQPVFFGKRAATSRFAGNRAMIRG